MKEKVIVVSPKGTEPKFNYLKNPIVNQINTPPIPKLLYHYGYVVDQNNLKNKSYDRIIVTTRRLKQNQVLICELSEDTCTIDDIKYGVNITFSLTYDAGNYDNESSSILTRSYRGLKSTRKNVRKYCDSLWDNPQFKAKQIGLSWARVWY